MHHANHISFAAIELTKKCNFACGHCYANSSPNEPLRSNMSDSDYHEALNLLIRNGVTAVQFIGGEPLLHPEICTFIAQCAEGGVNHIEVYTNITPLTDRHLKTFKTYGVSVATSYYSHIAAEHQATTNSKVELNRLDYNIVRCLENGIALRVSIIITEHNSKNVEVTIAHLKELGVNDISVDNVRSLGRQQESAFGDKEHGLCGKCGEGQVAIGHDGSLYPCVMARTSLGNIKIDGLNMLEGRLSEWRSDTFDYPMLDSAPSGQIGICPPQQSCPPYCGPGNGPCKPRLTCQPFSISTKQAV